MRSRLRLVGLRRSLVRSLVVGSVATMASAGLAVAQFKIGSGDVVADRQRLMRLNGASLQDLNAKLRAGNIEAAVVNAETIAINARHIPSLFPKGSLTDKSKAKPDIWEKWPEFEAAARNLQVKAEELRDAARRRDTQATEAAAKDFFRLHCNRCHAPFRIPLGS
jgi:cytochrome c556